MRATPDRPRLAALAARIHNNALVPAECAVLTGGTPAEDGFMWVQRLDDVPRSAYVRFGFSVLGQGADLDTLVTIIAQAGIQAEGFRIEFNSLLGDDHVAPRTAIIALADAISGAPNLDHPDRRFLLVERQAELCFGEILAEPDRSYRRYTRKPHRTSASLPSRLARALVNLVPPGAATIIDPCCGTASITLEALHLGLRVISTDWSRKMVWMARENLAHFGYPPDVQQIDARDLDVQADAVVTDLPYGRFLPSDDIVVQGILMNAARLAPLGIFVAGEDISAWMHAAGYTHVAVYPITKRNGSSRYVHVAQVQPAGPGVPGTTALRAGPVWER